jgi:hypothetical protein
LEADKQMEIQPADKRLRVIVGLGFLAAIAIGALSLVVLQAWLADLGSRAPADGRRILSSAFAWVMFAAFVSLLILGMYFWRVGTRVKAAQRFPLPGARVVVDTMVLHGVLARRRGTVIRGLGAVLVFCAVALAIASWHLYSLLFAHGA